MRRLTAAELKMVLERGIDPKLGLYTDELTGLSHGEAVEALALEVSERRVEENEAVAGWVGQELAGAGRGDE